MILSVNISTTNHKVCIYTEVYRMHCSLSFLFTEYPIPTDVNPSYNQPAVADRISDDSWLGDVSLEDLEDYSLESSGNSDGSGGGGGGGGGGGTNGDGNGGGNGGGNSGGGDGNSGNGGCGNDGSDGGGCGGGCSDYDGGGVEDDDYFDGGGGLDDEAILDRVANEMNFNFTDETSADHHSACAVMRSMESTVESSSCETDHQARGGIENASDLS